MEANQKIRLGMAVSAVLIAMFLVWLARGGLMPFFLGALLAYLISPLVNRIARVIRLRFRDAPWVRVTSILFVYLVILGSLTGIGALVVPQLVNSVNDLVDEQDRIIESFQERIDEWQERFNREVPEPAQEWVDQIIAEAGDSAGSWVGSIAGSALSWILSSIAAAIGFFIVPIWVFLVLKDQRKLKRGYYGMFPHHLRGDVRYMMRDADHVFGRYLRGMIILALVIGIMTYIGLRILNAPFALALSIIAAVGEVIPIVGPIISTVIAVAVVMALDPGITALWVLVLFVVVQQLENNILVPKIQGEALRTHPALIIMLVIIGSELYGILGMALLPPFYAIVRNSFTYVYRRVGGMPRPSHAAKVNGEARRAREEEMRQAEAAAEPAG